MNVDRIFFSGLQARMVAHAAAVILVGMLAGVGLLVSLIGGVEWWPGELLPLPMQPPTAGWVRAHVGGLLNGVLVLVVALLMPGLAFSLRGELRVANVLIGTGWVNTFFYWTALWAPNRALTFGDNRLGTSNLIGIVGLAPALLFVLLSFWAVAMVALQAWRQR